MVKIAQIKLGFMLNCSLKEDITGCVEKAN